MRLVRRYLVAGLAGLLLACSVCCLACAAALDLDTAALGDASLYDNAFPNLRWRYYNPGDYDQNGEVNAADLLPLAQHLGEHGDGPGPGGYGFDKFPTASIQSVLDGDENGEINQADLLAIARNFKHSALGGYRIYTDSLLPTEGELSSADALGNVPFASSGTNPVDERRLFELTLNGVSPALARDFFFAQLLDSGGTVVHTGLVLVPIPPPYTGDRAHPAYNAGLNQLTWLYWAPGDGDQNGLTNLADVSVIGVHLMEEVQPGSSAELVDTDYSRMIDIKDLIPFPWLWGRRVLGYRVYYSASEPALPQGTAPSGLSPLATVAFPPLPGGSVARLGFSYQFSGVPASGYYWLRPYGPGGVEGGPSDTVLIP
jgi:hypothetical protein